MKNIVTSFMNKISFQAKTTILVWIIIVGFALVVSVGLLTLIGLKSEFDINSSQEHNTHALLLLTEDYENKHNLPFLLNIWRQYKLHNASKNVDTSLMNLRKWYAKTFKPTDYEQIQNLIYQEYMLIESIDKAFINSDSATLTPLLKKQILLSLNIAFYEKKIIDSLYCSTFILLTVFMFIVITTIIILAISIRNSINTNHLLLEELVYSKTKELQVLNRDLQKSIEYEVEQNRKKDLIMYQQARLASMGEMIQNIAHQWRQPLNSLTILIQSFKSKAMQNKLSEEFVLQQTQYGIKIATEMSNTIENFRNFFHPETNIEPFELSASIWDSIALLKEQLKESNIRIEVLIENENLNINGYQNSFMQVILILINNAIDALNLKLHNENNFKNPCIEISLDKLEYNIMLSIKDNAGGINLEDKSKVFEPYFTTKHKSVGTGIGLYMAKQIIERQFNGSINVSNTHWRNEYFGAEFTISIPTQGKYNEI